MSGRARRPPLPLFALLAIGLAVFVARTGAGLDLGSLNRPVDNWLYMVLEALATALVFGRVAVERRNRRAWLLLAGYMVLWTVGDLGWTVHFDHVEDPPFPNWTDGAYITSYACAVAGLTLLLRDRGVPARLSLWLDGLLGGLTLGALCAALFLGPVIASAGGSRMSVAVTLAYPVLDVLLLCFVGVAFGVSNWRPGPMWALVGLSSTVAAVGDAVYAYQEATNSYSGTAWVNCTWPLALGALAWAAWCRPVRSAAAVDGEAIVAAPAVAGLVALGILLASQVHDVPLLAALLAAAALSAGGVRAWLTNRENILLLRHSRREALTDGLTNLGNRRRLMLDLDQVLAPEADRLPATLVFFDLDGFKGYNDSFGHGAGDALLVRLGIALAAAVDGAGRAYRLGGDEFCVLLDVDADRDHASVVEAAIALSEAGEGFAITSSYGVVRMPADADSPTVALQLADERMYDHKGSRRGSPRRQARDLLMQVLKEREPDLEEHVDDVGGLAVAVGRQLGLEEAELDELARGAELHDVGKIAIPDTILRKPGPLDDVEWQIMRQHTIIGERILAAAPALRRVARLVRCSHERWDGNGYPDGLSGREIPLGARIIAVCDAFDAMRQDRPYAPSQTEDEALAELRRCAGTQFDPGVVEAFAIVLSQGAGDELRVA